MKLVPSINIEIEFPCGYKLKVDWVGGMFQNTPRIDGLDECPLHGKRCKKFVKKQDGEEK